MDDEEADAYRYLHADSKDANGRRYPVSNAEGLRHKHELWDQFKHHHYMGHELNESGVVFIARWHGVPIGLHALAVSPGIKESGCKNTDESRTTLREHRVVM
eukprot:5611341-Prymnesium_polylepis.1